MRGSALLLCLALVRATPPPMHGAVSVQDLGDTIIGSEASGCPPEKPYTDPALVGVGTASSCVAQCPSGAAPNSDNVCAPCQGEGEDVGNKFADHLNHACVARCPSGSVPNDDNDCESCGDRMPFANQETQECVSDCPPGQAPGPRSWIAGALEDNDCAQCSGETPFADHTHFSCVAHCTPGHAPNHEADCAPCPYGTYADQLNNTCVSSADECPEGTNPNSVNRNCDLDCEGKPFMQGFICVDSCSDGEAPVGGTGDDKDNCRRCGGDTPYVKVQEVGRIGGPVGEKAEVPLTLQKCVAQCPEGHAPLGGLTKNKTHCVPCDHYADHVNHKCVESCPENYLANETSRDCELLDPCKDKPFQQDGACVESCSPDSVPQGGNGTNAMVCIQCTQDNDHDSPTFGADLFADHTTNRCVPSCPDGSIGENHACKCPFKDGSNCVLQCPDGAAADAKNMCTPCELFVHQHACVDVCPGGFAPLGGNGTNANHCEACNELMPYSDENQCVPECPSARPYHVENGCLNKCGAGMAPKGGALDDAKSCIVCKDELFDIPKPYADQDQMQCVSSCPFGSAPDKAGDCTTCKGTTPYATSTACVTSCPSGAAPKGGDGADANQCQSCPGDSGDKNIYADHVNHICTAECPSGTAPDEAKDCVACEGNTPFADNAQAKQCVKSCPEGSAPDEDRNCVFSRAGTRLGERWSCDKDSPEPYQADQNCFAKCPSSHPFNEGFECFVACPTGYAPNDDNECIACEGDKPYSDTTQNMCVAKCPSGSIPNEHKECTACGDETPYADQAKLACVASCPPETAPNEENDCEVEWMPWE